MTLGDTLLCCIGHLHTCSRVCGDVASRVASQVTKALCGCLWVTIIGWAVPPLPAQIRPWPPLSRTRILIPPDLRNASYALWVICYVLCQSGCVCVCVVTWSSGTGMGATGLFTHTRVWPIIGSQSAYDVDV